ncbi:hypothetical protein KKH3_17860 [Pectobacterium actinidiae]|nr:hypothetical protein KKH3_17860 [Pectobacterium actinidiae]
MGRIQLPAIISTHHDVLLLTRQLTRSHGRSQCKNSGIFAARHGFSGLLSDEKRRLL